MIWSISTDKMFRRCQRQWFYKQVYGNANSRKDRSRYEAFLLSKLQSLSALRGQVVDDVLSEHLVPALNRGIVPRCEEIRSRARERFEQRLAYAKAHQLDQRLSAPAKLPDQFAMLFDYEYGVGITDEDYDRAFAEIDSSIENLFAMEDLLDTLKGSERILSQRALMWKIGENSIRAVPDVIAFFRQTAPIVLDWKVHYFANADAARQLASYALALARVNPHKDFPLSAVGWPEIRTRLLEVQLLKGEIREHEYSEDEYADLEGWIVSRVLEANLALYGRKKSSDFLPTDFPTAFDGRQCSICNFKRLCWSKDLTCIRQS
jgi:hypothetical protein